jgi:hypothetical protein
MDTIRNPNRFLHLVHLGVGILAAFGMEYFWKSITEDLSDTSKKLSKFIFRAGLALIGMTLLVFIVLFFSQDSLRGFFEKMLPADQIDKAINLIYNSLLRFVVYAFLMCVVLWSLLKWPTRTVLRWTLIVSLGFIAVLDVAQIDKQFIRFYNPKNAPGKDPLVDFLIQEKTKGPYRIKFITRGPYLNYFLNNFIPQYQLETCDVTATRSFPVDFETFTSAVNPNSARLYQFEAVRFFLSEMPYQIFGMLPKYQFPNPFEQGKSIYVYEETNAVPMAKVYTSVIVETNFENIFSIFNSPVFNPSKEMVLTKAPAETFALGSNGGEVTWSKLEPERVEMKVSVEGGGILVLADRYTPDWEALVDGKPSKLFRANYLFQGVYVPSGEHQVIIQMKRTWFLQYFPSAFFYLLTLLCIGILFYLAFLTKAKNQESATSQEQV